MPSNEESTKRDANSLESSRTYRVHVLAFSLQYAAIGIAVSKEHLHRSLDIRYPNLFISKVLAS